MLAKHEDLLIFENEGVSVFYEARASDFLLITFSPMNLWKRDNGTFYASVPSAKKGWSVIGFVAKHDHWYPEEYMKDAIAAVQSIVSKHNQVVLHGVSMGAYAALRYSKRLHATHQFLLSPQWSINPAKSGDTRFKEQYAGFADLLDDIDLTADDVAGHITLVYDPLEKPDRLQVRHIEESGIRIDRPVFAYSGGHTLGLILVGSDFLERMLSAIVSDAPRSTFTDEVNTILRKHPFRVQALVRHATEKHSLAVARAINDLKPGAALLNEAIYKPQIIALARHLQRTARPSFFFEFCSKFSWMNADFKSDLFSKRSFNNLVRTAHGNIVVFDTIDDDLTLKRIDDATADCFTIPVSAISENGIIALSLVGRYSPVFNAGHKKYSLAPDQAQMHNPFLNARKLKDFWVISNGQYVATATPKGKLDFGVTHVKDWERFVA